jgi:hypothetical protein
MSSMSTTVSSGGLDDEINSIGKDARGLHIPRSCCKCYAAARYGKDKKWYCDTCWIDMVAPPKPPETKAEEAQDGKGIGHEVLTMPKKD